MNILLTGAAGFIGYHTAEKLIQENHYVIGIDNLNDYYDVRIKHARLTNLKKHQKFQFHKVDLADRAALETIFKQYQFDCVINLAAQAGVRYSLTNPHTYMDSNIIGFCNILECCRHHHIDHLIFASSSSVYGSNTKMPFSESDNVDHPISLYAASKKANELMAHAYAHLYQLSCTGLRFFTVYGPWGRPDMALFKFTQKILDEEPIDVYNHGAMLRDFTYVDDIVTGILKLIHHPATADSKWDSAHPNPATSQAPYRIYNIGNSNPVPLNVFIEEIEAALGKQAKKNLLPLQPGDVPATVADTSALKLTTGFQPYTPIKKGISQFIKWYVEEYIPLMTT